MHKHAPSIKDTFTIFFMKFHFLAFFLKKKAQLFYNKMSAVFLMDGHTAARTAAMDTFAEVLGERRYENRNTTTTAVFLPVCSKYPIIYII